MVLSSAIAGKKNKAANAAWLAPDAPSYPKIGGKEREYRRDKENMQKLGLPSGFVLVTPTPNGCAVSTATREELSLYKKMKWI